MHLQAKNFWRQNQMKKSPIA